jgi:hypothetical protein
VALPLFGGVIAYLASPGWMAWASLHGLLARWLNVALISWCPPLGPEHPGVERERDGARNSISSWSGRVRTGGAPSLYTTGIALFVGIGLMA